MNETQLLQNLKVPAGKVDAILDTDTYNEIDDQFALSYMLRSSEKINTVAICAAPFFNYHSTSPKDGMERSFDEIIKLLTLAGRTDMFDKVYHGSEQFLTDEKTPVESDAARVIVELAQKYSPEKPLYVVAIGAITNVASALLMDPSIKEKIVIVWLGGNALHIGNSREFNMFQDVAAARIVFGCGAPLVQLPCDGVVSAFTTSKPELEYWLSGKNALCDYLVQNTVREAESYAAGKPWTRVIWDVTAVAWLLNDGGRFMAERIIHAPIPEYDDHYGMNDNGHFMNYVYRINRDALFEDLFRKLAGEG